MAKTQKQTCWQKSQKIEGWLECFNKLLFLIEVEKLGLQERVVQVGGETLDHQQRTEKLRNFNSFITRLAIKQPELAVLIKAVSTEFFSSPRSLTQLGETVENLLKEAYAYGALWGNLQQIFSLQELLTILAHQQIERVEVSTINEVVETYQEALEKQLINQANQTQTNYLITLPLRKALQKKALPSQPTETKKVELPPPPSATDLRQVEELKGDLYQQASTFLESNLKLPKNKESLERVKQEMDRLLTHSITEAVDNLIWWGEKNIDEDSLASLVSQKIIDNLLLSEDIQDKIFRQSWLDLRASLKKHPVDLEGDLQKSLFSITEKRSDHLQAVNRLTTFSRQAPLNSSDLKNLAEDVIRRQLNLSIPNAAKYEKEINTLAEQAANYIIYVKPAEKTLIAPSALGKILQESSFAQAHPKVKEIIDTTGVIFKRPSQRMFRLPKGAWEKYLFKSLFTNEHNRGLIIENGLNPLNAYDSLLHSTEELENQLNWLKEGAPIKVFGKTIATRQPLTEGDKLYHQLDEAINWRKTHQENLKKIKLPFLAKSYLKVERLKTKLIGQPLLKLTALLSLPSYQLSVGLNHIREEVQDSQAVQEVINSRHWPTINKILGGVEAVAHPKALRKKVREKIREIWRKSFVGKGIRQTRLKAYQLMRKHRSKKILGTFLKVTITPGRSIRSLRKKLAAWWKRFKNSPTGKWAGRIFKGIWLITHPKQLLKKGLIWGLKKIGQLSIKILSKLGLDLAGLASGIGSVLAILSLLKDLYSVFRRWWKEILVFIAGWLYLIINFILSHLLAFIGGLIGGFIGGPVGFALGLGVGFGLEQLFGSLSALVGTTASLASSLWGTMTAFATSTSGVTLALTVIPGGTVLALTSFFWYPYLSTAFLKSNLYYQSGGTQYLTLYKNLRLDKVNSKYILKDERSAFPHLNNSAAEDKIKLTFKIQMKAEGKNLKIVAVKDTNQIYTKDSHLPSGRLAKTITYDLTSKFQDLTAGDEEVVEYQFPLKPEYKNSRLANTLQVTVEDDKGNEYHKTTGFVTLIGQAPLIGCQEIAAEAEKLANQLYRCSDNQIADCYCPSQSNPALGYFVNSYHCGDTGENGPFKNYIHADANWVDQENHYIQCTEFVNDVYRNLYQRSLYNLCGGATFGNAGDWLKNAPKSCHNFLVGVPNQPGNTPSLGDILVFRGGENGHVGIVTQLGLNTLTFASANVGQRFITLENNGGWKSILPGLRLVGWLHNLSCQP